MVEKTSDDLVISISTDPSAATRGLKRLQADVAAATGTIQKQFDSVGRGINNSMTTALQSRIEGMVGIGTKAAKEWNGALADQGKELERLRARYSPLFATINNYKTAVADIRRAHALGAISATEMASAIQKERQAALASTAAIKGRNAALADTPGGSRGMGNRAFNTSNLAAQGFDVATTAAFMPWYTVALQQGPQVAQVFNDIRASGASIGPAVAGAFAQILNPVSLVTIGVIAATAAAVQYFTQIEWGGQKSEATLKREAELVATVAQKWGEALPALKAYNDERQRAADGQELSEALAIGASAQWEDLRKALSDVDVQMADIVSRVSQMGEDTGQISSLQRVFGKLAEDIDKGSATADQAREAHAALAEVVKNNATPELEAYLAVFEKLIPAIDAASGRASKFSRDAAIALTSRFPSRGTYGGVERSADGTIQGIGTPLPFNGPTPEGRPLIELDGLPGADKGAKKAETAAQRAANAYRDLIKSADDRIAQLQLESDLLGTYGAATDAARFRLDLLQQAEDKGRSLNEAQRAEIEQKVALYAKFSEALAQAKLQQDLLNKARFTSLSKQDQQIVTTLRQYGLSEDLGSRQAAMIRQSLESDEIREGVSSFLGDFKSALLENGGDIGDAFGTALLNALMNSMNKQWESIFDLLGSGIASMMRPAASGGLGGFPAAPGGAAAAGGVSSAVDLASGLFGASEGANRGSINSFLKRGGVDIDAAQTAWCAAFVNSSLEQVGVKGSGSLTANSFQNWGSSVNLADVMRGDVLLQSRGLGAGQPGGHVGFATGASRMGASGLQLEMLSGNSGNAVTTEWVNAVELQARRATEAASSLASVGSTAQQATQGLGQLGSAMSGSGGGGGWLSGILGGRSQWSMAQSGLLKPGLFADGGSVRGPGGPRSDVIPALLSNGEFVVNARQTQKHRAILEAINSGSFARLADGGVVAPRIVSTPRAPRLSARSGAQMVRNETALTVQIQGASGDDHVRMLVKQGVEAGLHASRENDRRGGFGQIQTSYISQRA